MVVLRLRTYIKRKLLTVCEGHVFLGKNMRHALEYIYTLCNVNADPSEINIPLQSIINNKAMNC